MSTKTLLEELGRRSIACAIISLTADANGEVWISNLKGGPELMLASMQRLADRVNQRIITGSR